MHRYARYVNVMNVELYRAGGHVIDCPDWNLINISSTDRALRRAYEINFAKFSRALIGYRKVCLHEKKKNVLRRTIFSSGTTQKSTFDLFQTSRCEIIFVFPRQRNATHIRSSGVFAISKSAFSLLSFFLFRPSPQRLNYHDNRNGHSVRRKSSHELWERARFPN